MKFQAAKTNKKSKKTADHTFRYVTFESKFVIIPPVASYSSSWASTLSIHSFKAGISLCKLCDSPKAEFSTLLASVI